MCARMCGGYDGARLSVSVIMLLSAIICMFLLLYRGAIHCFRGEVLTPGGHSPPSAYIAITRGRGNGVDKDKGSCLRIYMFARRERELLSSVKDTLPCHPLASFPFPHSIWGIHSHHSPLRCRSKASGCLRLFVFLVDIVAVVFQVTVFFIILGTHYVSNESAGV